MKSKFWRLSLIPTVLLMLAPALSNAQISVSVNIAPPELPVYDQPPIPGDGYLWTPGYWAWGDDIQDYYWVPGAWIEAPQPNYLWTPGYWAADGAAFFWHAGYWGPQIGFYGGVNYGFGYGGQGYEGGYWRDGHIFYNRAVVNVGSVHITNVYNKTVVNNTNVTRVSFNGGNGGVRARATSAELAAARGPHIEATSAQRERVQTARGNPELRAANNHGRPPIGATPRAGNANDAAHNDTRREPPRPRITTPHPNQQIAPNPREAQPRPAAPSAPVEPRREPEHTEAVKPAPKPQARPAPRPAEHPAEHPEEHEHHQS